MKKSKVLAIILSILFITTAFMAIPVSAASEGFDDIAGAAGGKNALMSLEFIDGGAGFNEKEGSASIVEYDNKADFPKYCTDQLPYWAEWKYDQAYVVNRIILQTGNDSKQSPRRMGDGWTLSGSNDGSSWTVVYTGKETDVENEDDMFYFVDVNGNKEAYQYYKLYSEAAGSAEGQDRNLIQYGMIVLCGDVPAADDEASGSGDGGSSANTSSNNDDGGSNMILLIVIGAIVVVVIVIVIVLVTRKKKE